MKRIVIHLYTLLIFILPQEMEKRLFHYNDRIVIKY